MSARVQFTGGKELQRALLELSNKQALTVGRFALRRAANAFLRELRAAAPINKGRLRRSLKVRIDRGRYNKSLLSALVYASQSASEYRSRKTRSGRYNYQIGSRPDVYGIFQEFGAPAHNLPARPWFRPTWEKQKQTALSSIARELGVGLVREVMRSGKRS